MYLKWVSFNKIKKLFALEDNVITKLLSEYKTSLTDAEEKVLQTSRPAKQQIERNIGNRNGKATASKVDIQEILKKSVITPEFEKLHSVPASEVSDKKLREMRKV